MAESVIRIGGDRCPHCMGTGREPSPIISIRNKCSRCRGNGSLIGGRPNYGMPLKDYIAAHTQSGESHE